MITLFCMTKRGFVCLESLVKEYGLIIDNVILSEDAQIEDDYFKQIKGFCEINNIPHKHRKDFYTIKSKYVFAIGWRWIIPTSDDYKIIVFHDSLLPRFRGFAPLVNSLIAGEKKIGVTALMASQKYDEGPIICQFSSTIKYPIKVGTALDLNLKNYCLCILKVVEMIRNKEEVKGIEQKHELATYSIWRDDSDYKINWYQDSIYIKRFIDAVSYPYKCANTFIDNRMLRISEAEIYNDVSVENRNENIGKIIFLEGYPVVICGKGLLKIKEAVWDDNGVSAIPFKKFRIRLL